MVMFPTVYYPMSGEITPHGHVSHGVLTNERLHCITGCAIVVTCSFTYFVLSRDCPACHFHAHFSYLDRW